jgi:hypothetical protein
MFVAQKRGQGALATIGVLLPAKVVPRTTNVCRLLPNAPALRPQLGRLDPRPGRFEVPRPSRIVSGLAKDVSSFRCLDAIRLDAVFSFVTSSINTAPGRWRRRERAERCICAPRRMDEVLAISPPSRRTTSVRVHGELIGRHPDAHSHRPA